MPRTYAQIFLQALVGPYGEQLLRASGHGDLILGAKRVEQRAVLEIVVQKTRQPDIGQHRDVEKYRHSVEQPQPLEIDASRTPLPLFHRKRESLGPRPQFGFQNDVVIEGYYVYMTCEVTPEMPAELDRVFKITDGILRSIIVAVEE